MKPSRKLSSFFGIPAAAAGAQRRSLYLAVRAGPERALLQVGPSTLYLYYIIGGEERSDFDACLVCSRTSSATLVEVGATGVSLALGLLDSASGLNVAEYRGSGEHDRVDDVDIRIGALVSR